MAYYPAGNAWTSWNEQWLQTAATSQTVWTNWNIANYTPAATMPVEHTAPDFAAIKAQNEKLEAARKRAKEFLVEHLDADQRESYQRSEMFIVETPKKNRYALHYRHNPKKLNGDKPVTSYCIHTYGVPREDELLGFKLLLEANEDEFLKTANATALAA